MIQSGPINPAIEYGSVDDLNRIAAEAAGESTTGGGGEYDSGDVDALLITLVNNLQYARKIAQWLQPSYLNNYMGAENWQFAIWVALRDLLLQSESEDPDPLYVARSASTTAMRLYGDERVGTIASAAVLEMTRIRPMREISDRIIKYLYSKCVTRPNVQSLMMEARDAESFDEIFARIENMNLKRAQSIVDEEAAAGADAFESLDYLDRPMDEGPLVEESHRIGTGVPYIDALHRGEGIYRGFTTLIAGATGGGKSVVNYELIASLTSQNYSVGLVATEEDPSKDPEPRARLWSACTDVTKQEWQAVGCDPRRLEYALPPPQIDRLRRIRSNLTIYRLSPVTWASVISELENHFIINDNKMHDVVVVDWAGPLATDMVASGECSSMHEALENICIWASQHIARKYQCAVVIFHQLADAAVARSGVYGKYGKGDTQNCRKMSQHCAAMHVISQRDPKTDRARYIGAKLRFDKEGVESLIQLDYEHGRFSCIDDVFEIRAGRFVAKKKNKDGAEAMPDASKRRNTKLGEAGA